jgi:hypothetical protein
MGELSERVKLSKLVYGSDEVRFYQEYIYNNQKDENKEKEVTEITPSPKVIQPGRFYHLEYGNVDSNWIQFSPIFVVDYRGFSNEHMLFALNLNFIPFEIRMAIFDKYMVEKDFENDRALVVSYEGVDNELKKWGFEYAIEWYNFKQIASAHRINMSVVPRFLYSSHPKNKYDPKKLYSIRDSKLSRRDARDAEMRKLLMSDFLKTSAEIKEEFKELSDHILRVQKGLRGK